MTTLPPAPTYFHKPVSALNAHGGAVVRPDGCKWLNYEGEIAHRDRAHGAQRLAGRGGRLHRRLHDRQRLRAARLPRHRRRLDAAGQGLGHAVPARPRPGRRLGLPRQAVCARSSTARSCRTATPTRWSGTCTTSSPTSPAPSRCSPATCCCPGTPAISRTVYPGRRRRGRGRGPRHGCATTSSSGPTPIRDRRAAPSRPRARRSLSTALGRRLGVPRHPGARPLSRRLPPLLTHATGWASRPAKIRRKQMKVIVDLASARTTGSAASPRPRSSSSTTHGKLVVCADHARRERCATSRGGRRRLPPAGHHRSGLTGQ